MTGSIEEGVRTLYPGYFAMVMATGIVSNAFHFIGRSELSSILLVIAAVAFPVLVAATIARAARHRRELWADLTNPRLVFSFFTIVAAADVLGIGLSIRGEQAVATGLWLFALVVWTVLSYFSFALLTFSNNEEGADVVHGGWLIMIVGTESLALLGLRLAPDLGAFQDVTFIAVHSLWGIGIVLYGIFVTLFSYRIFFARLEPGDMGPLFWVIMGAAAIATNAGSALLVARPDLSFLQAMHPFVDGATLILWAWATWWIPLLVIFGFWRHVVRREPLRYHPSYWSLVFPLGMYTVATWRLSLAADYEPMREISRAMVWIAFGAWLVTMTGLLRSLWRMLAPPRAAASNWRPT